MEQEKNIKIHETAFVTSTFRAFDENLSQDNFAKLWQNSKTERWIEEYLDQVSSEETYTHCLRNRYFLDRIKDLVQNQEIEVLINFGSGFSMYPFLLNEKLINIEVDKPEIIDWSQKRDLNPAIYCSTLVLRKNLYFVCYELSKKREPYCKSFDLPYCLGNKISIQCT